MSIFTFYTHIPLLRLDDGIQFGQGVLFPMKFDDYNSMTLGAFEDHRKEYEATAPVFYRVYIDMDMDDLPNIQPIGKDIPGMLEMKLPAENWYILYELGMGLVPLFHNQIVDPAWLALLLAAPASGIPSPRLSVTFVFPPDNYEFIYGERRGQGIHLQGDADQEYLFLSEASGPPVPPETIQFASELVDFVKQQSKNREFLSAFSYLAASSSPTLSKFEQLTLSVIALEALLLPEMRKSLQSTFSRRLSNLLSVDEEHRRELKKVANKLYGYRSAGVHGDLSFNDQASRTVNLQYAPQVLAASILSLAGLRDKRQAQEVEPSPNGGNSSGQPLMDGSLEVERQLLDGNTLEHNGIFGRVPLPNPPGMRAPNRLVRTNTPFVAGFTASENVAVQSLDAPEGSAISWSPLIGMSIVGDGLALGGIHDPILLPFNVEELISMEERDIRRDFLSSFHVGGSTFAGMMVKRDIIPDYMSFAEVEPFQRIRDLGVIALRLFGFRNFTDPELLGWYIYVESIRHRFPTVFRQTIYELLRHEQKDQVNSQDKARIVPLWNLLAQYNSTARDAGIDRLLTMYRRIFDQRFLPITARAGLMFSMLEAMLGKFRPRDEALQLHHLVTALTGQKLPDEASWFEREGRDFRNSVAHGFWNIQEEQAQQPLDALTSILTALLPQFLTTWLALENREGLRAGQVFTEQATKLFNGEQTPSLSSDLPAERV